MKYARFARTTSSHASSFESTASTSRVHRVTAAVASPSGGDDSAWRRSARSDYLWMAKEFNRQYVNSHGKEHDDYQPHSAITEL